MSPKDDIEIAVERLESRHAQFEIEVAKVGRKVVTYTKWAWGFVIFGFLIVIVGLWAYFSCRTNLYYLNLLGDFYGGSVASVWSLAGLFFIYVAFLGQKQQLIHQQMEIMFSQVELKYTRLELEGQKIEMIAQNRTLSQQRFENTFFQLLRNHQDIVNGMDIRSLSRADKRWSVSASGRDCFKVFHSRFSEKCSKVLSIDDTLPIFKVFYDKHQADLGHYFRNLYHILKFVNNSDEIPVNDKFKYTSMLRALLSSYELALLFYNGLSENGIDFFKPLLEKFSFLKNMDEKLLISIDHQKAYSELAFAGVRDREKFQGLAGEEKV